MAKGKSISVNFLKSKEQLKDEVEYKNFKYKKHFELVCKLIPDKDNETLIVKPINEELTVKEGIVYVFVIDGKIFKVGESINSIKDRVQSYNCGKLEYRLKGTCSTTNFYVLQSLLTIGEEVDVYGYFPIQPEYTIFGKKYKSSKSAAKVAENLIIKDFIEEYDKKPIGCTQQ